MNSDSTIVYLVTKNYDAMKQFFVDLGLDVWPETPQCSPLLNQGRGCLINLASLQISLEECTDVPPSGPLYLQFDGIDTTRISALKAKYTVRRVNPGFYDGEHYRIVPPDGGVVIVLPKTSS